MNHVIETKQLTKTYQNFTAVNNLNLQIKKGIVYGFLGPNGAGKSTTMKMLLDLTKPTSGSLKITGLSHQQHRKEILSKIGSLIESPSYYGNLTAQENLDIISKILQLPSASVTEALDTVGLSDFKNRLVKKFSLGMKQRLGIAMALLGNPEILILDEPTNGLDPSGIHEIRNLIRSLPKKYDCTVFVSSHLLSEIELMADEVGIVNKGHLLFQGTFEQLTKQAIVNQIPSKNLEEIFLAMIDADNSIRKGA